MSTLIEKTCDVRYTPDILKILGGDMLLHARGYNLLEYLSCDLDILERRSRLFTDPVTIPSLQSAMDETVETLTVSPKWCKCKAVSPRVTATFIL